MDIPSQLRTLIVSLLLFCYWAPTLTEAVDARTVRNLTQEDKDMILDAHNYIRSRVDPPATNMQKMVREFF